MNTSKKGFYNTYYALFAQFITLAFAFIMPKLVIENYGSEINGLLRSSNELFAYLSLLEAGIGTTAIQALYLPVSNRNVRKISRILAAVHKYYIKIGYLYILCVTLCAALFPLVVKTELRYYEVFFVVLFSGLGGGLSFFFQGKYILLLKALGDTYIESKTNVFISILSNCVRAVLLLRSYNVLVIQFSFFCVQILKTIVLQVYILRKYNKINLNVTPDYKAISQKKHVLIHQLSTLVFNNTDILMLTFITRDLRIVSVYSLYNSIVKIVMGIIQNCTSGFEFRMGQIYVADKDRYMPYFNVHEIINLVLTFSLMGTLNIVIIPFMTLYTKGINDISYIDNVCPVLFVIIPLLQIGKQTCVMTITFAAHFRQTTKYAIMEAIINVTISVLGVICWGITGALIGTIVASLYRAIIDVWYCYRYAIKGKITKSIIRWVICLIIFFVSHFLFQHVRMVVKNYFDLLLFSMIFGIGSFTLYFLALYFTNSKERIIIKTMIIKITKDICHRRLGESEI